MAELRMETADVATRYLGIGVMALMLLAGLSTGMAQQPAPTQPAPANQQALPEVERVERRKAKVGEEAGSVEMVCRNLRVTGTRKREQICHTKAEWAAMRRNAGDAVRTTQQQPTGSDDGN